MEKLEFELMPSETPIQPIMIGDSQTALDMSSRLFDEGIYLTAIRPPTVPIDSARLRVTLSASHEKSDIDVLVSQLMALHQKS